MTSALALVRAEADDVFLRARSANTLRAYRTDVRNFAAWCRAQDLPDMPAHPDTVRMYLTTLMGRYRYSSIARALAAIAWTHELAGQPSPSAHPHVKVQLQAIRRTLGVAPTKKAPVRLIQLQTLGDQLGSGSIKDIRDHAIIMLGFAGAFRRSELVALDVEDLEISDDGYRVTLRRSKTDQDAAGRVVGIPFASAVALCPVRALGRWLETAQISSGPVFRPLTRGGRVRAMRLSGDAVGRIVQARLGGQTYGGHSLRSGFITLAADRGVSMSDIARTTGHTNMAVLQGYIQHATVFRRNAFAQLGL